MSAATIAAALAWYEANIADCPRSPEWKAGARAGCWQAHGLVPSPNPYPRVTCQDDARRLVLVDVDKGGSDVLPAEPLGCGVSVVSAENLAGRLVHDNRPELPVAFEAFGNGVDVASAWVAPAGLYLPDGEGQFL